MLPRATLRSALGYGVYWPFRPVLWEIRLFGMDSILKVRDKVSSVIPWDGCDPFSLHILLGKSLIQLLQLERDGLPLLFQGRDIHGQLGQATVDGGKIHGLRGGME
jgi:hypothetical protein